MPVARTSAAPHVAPATQGDGQSTVTTKSKAKALAYDFIDITMRPEIQAIIGNNGGVPVAADPADITDPKSGELISTFNGILDNDGLSFYPDWPAAGFYDVIVRELQGLVTGTQDAETTNANLGAEYEEGTADFR